MTGTDMYVCVTQLERMCESHDLGMSSSFVPDDFGAENVLRIIIIDK